MSEIPHLPLELILDPVSIDLTDETNTYPLLEDLTVADSVGPESANRQPRALDLRTEALRALLNDAVEALNSLNTNLLHRDGASATVGGFATPSFMRGDLSLTDLGTSTAYRVINTAAAVADTDAVTKSQLDALSTFLNGLQTSLTEFLRRDGTLAMQAHLNMGGNTATNLAVAVNAADAITKGTADASFNTLTTGHLKRDGTLAMQGDLNMGGNKVTNLDLGVPSSDGDAVSRAYLLQILSDIAETPPGTIAWFAGDVSVSGAPTGWLVANGQAVSRTTYANLFAVLGTVYGVGDGSTTFGLPDFRGRVAVGMDNMGSGSAGVVTDAQADVLGGAFGAESVVLTTAQLPPHTHTYDDAYVTPGAGGALTGPSATNVTSEFDEILGRTTGSSGSGDAHANIQPSIALYVLIKF